MNQTINLKDKQNVINETFYNTGDGPHFQIIDINHPDYYCLIEPDTAFWMLIPGQEIGQVLKSKELINQFLEKKDQFNREMQQLRFGLKPSAVYFNPTERCNFNCSYCYLPEDLRKNGQHMSARKMSQALKMLKDYFNQTIDDARLPQIIFHGAEPLLNKDALFPVIREFKKDFHFGIQTNAVLLTEQDVDFLTSHNVAVGISLDGDTSQLANQTRFNWEGKGNFEQVVKAIDLLRGYASFSVICTLTRQNIQSAPDIIEFFHKNHVETCMLNILRCTQPYSHSLKPDEDLAADYFIRALDRSYQLYQESGRKIVVANFANILLSIIAPTARRLMCDISPCGGGRCFFAVSARGELFPCSEFIGLQEFNAGSIFDKSIDTLLESQAVQKVTSRQVENITPCQSCAVRHFCGAPCPAEAYQYQGGRDKIGGFCRFYEKQARYAFRLIADEKYNDFLFDRWDQDMDDLFDWSMLKM